MSDANTLPSLPDANAELVTMKAFAERAQANAPTDQLIVTGKGITAAVKALDAATRTVRIMISDGGPDRDNDVGA